MWPTRTLPATVSSEMGSVTQCGVTPLLRTNNSTASLHGMGEPPAPPACARHLGWKVEKTWETTCVGTTPSRARRGSAEFRPQLHRFCCKAEQSDSGPLKEMCWVLKAQWVSGPVKHVLACEWDLK